MGSHMNVQVTSPGERPGTHLAHVWAQTSVSAHVCHEGTSEREWQSTNFAGKRSFPCMSDHDVTLQRAFERERLLTDITSVRSLTSVTAHMSLQFGTITEWFATHAT